MQQSARSKQSSEKNSEDTNSDYFQQVLRGGVKYRPILLGSYVRASLYKS